MTTSGVRGDEPVREFTYAQTSRYVLTVTDGSAVVSAAAACWAAHGRARVRGGNLPPTVAVDASTITGSTNAEDVEVMDDPVLGALWRLLECGRHGVADDALPGVASELANHSGDLGPWPPWPTREAL